MHAGAVASSSRAAFAVCRFLGTWQRHLKDTQLGNKVKQVRFRKANFVMVFKNISEQRTMSSPKSLGLEEEEEEERV